jgi:predicted kinase
VTTRTAPAHGAGLGDTSAVGDGDGIGRTADDDAVSPHGGSGGSPDRLFVVVSGRPGSGKSTVAAPLASALGLDLLVKDAIKQALVDVLGAADVETSRAFGRAARHVLITVAATSTGAVLDSVWPRDDGAPDGPAGALRALPGTVVEVHCHVPAHVAAQRWRVREAGVGAAGSFSADRGSHEQARAGQPVAGGWPVLRVDTSVPVDVAALVARIRAAAR